MRVRGLCIETGIDVDMQPACQQGDKLQGFAWEVSCTAHLPSYADREL